MLLGINIHIPVIAGLGLGEFNHTLENSATSRRVKVFKVPEAVSVDRYFVSATEYGAVEVVPPSRVKNTVLLVDFDLDPDNRVTKRYIHPEVGKAMLS